MVAGALGVFILWFGWYGFNVGSALAAVDVNLAAIAVTTTLSASAASITAMYTSMIAGKPNVGMTLNGALAGLVGITAGCANVNNLGAVLIGTVIRLRPIHLRMTRQKFRNWQGRQIICTHG